MTETPADPPSPAPAAPEQDPVALYGADAVSGARFLRWNLGAAVLGLLGLGVGLTLAPPREVAPPGPRAFRLERLAEDVEVEVPGGRFTADHLRVEGDGLPWEVWLTGGARPALVKWQQGAREGALAAD